MYQKNIFDKQETCSDDSFDRLTHLQLLKLSYASSKRFVPMSGLRC